VIVHVKLTEHFLIQAGERMTKRDRGEMTTFLLSPTLFRIAEALSPGERAAACLGDGLIVFCRDAADSSVLAVLTYLGPDEAHVVSRRFDTTLVRVEATM
jgi:hypothetical protein